MDKEFAFDMGAEVTLESGESGKVIGQSRWAEANDEFLIRYTAGDGRLTQHWWPASAIKTIATAEA